MNVSKLLLPALLLALSACASTSPARSPQPACPQPPPLPARLTLERSEDFLLQMCNFLFDSPRDVAMCRTSATSAPSTPEP